MKKERDRKCDETKKNRKQNQKIKNKKKGKYEKHFKNVQLRINPITSGIR